MPSYRRGWRGNARIVEPVRHWRTNMVVRGGRAAANLRLRQRQANLRFTKARCDELVASYELAVQGAFREVTNGLVGRQRLQEQIKAQEQTVAVQRRLAEVSELRYENGVSPIWKCCMPSVRFSRRSRPCCCALRRCRTACRFMRRWAAASTPPPPTRHSKRQPDNIGAGSA